MSWLSASGCAYSSWTLATNASGSTSWLEHEGQRRAVVARSRGPSSGMRHISTKRWLKLRDAPVAVDDEDAVGGGVEGRRAGATASAAAPISASLRSVTSWVVPETMRTPFASPAVARIGRAPSGRPPWSVAMRKSPVNGSPTRGGRDRGVDERRGSSGWTRARNASRRRRRVVLVEAEQAVELVRPLHRAGADVELPAAEPRDLLGLGEHDLALDRVPLQRLVQPPRRDPGRAHRQDEAAVDAGPLPRVPPCGTVVVDGLRDRWRRRCRAGTRRSRWRRGTAASPGRA